MRLDILIIVGSFHFKIIFNASINQGTLGGKNVNRDILKTQAGDP